MPTTVFDKTTLLSGTDDGNGNQNFNLRELIAASLLGAATGTQMRITVSWGSAEGTETPALDDMWVAPNNPGVAQAAFDGTQVQVTFGGLTSANGSAGGLVTSDWITLGSAYSNGNNYLFAYHLVGAHANISFAALTGANNFGNPTPGTSTASQTNPSGLALFNSDTIAFITKIEIQAAVADVLAAQIWL